MKIMKILAINTALKRTTVTLLTGEKIAKEKSWLSKNDEAEKLMPVISKMVKSYDDLDAVAIVKGPGSFTGLRIGVTVANTIAYLQKIPVYELNTFQLLWKSQEAAGDPVTKRPKGPQKKSQEENSLALLLFAGKKEVYLQFKQEGPVVILPIEKAKEALENENVTHTFGSLIPEQATQFKKFKFKETKPVIPTMKNFKKVKTAKPLYVKGPAISKPKPGLK